MTALVRSLVVSNILLTAAVLVLIFRIFISPPGLQQDGLPNGDSIAHGQTAETPLSDSANHSGANLPPELERSIRRAIRTELRRFVASPDPEDASQLLQGREQRAIATPPGQRLPTEEQQIQNRIVQEEIVHYIQQGRISSAEMTALQSEIAKLRPDNRMVAMRQLVAAINSGDLEGRL